MMKPEVSENFMKLIKKLKLKKFFSMMNDFINTYLKEAGNKPVEYSFEVSYFPCFDPSPKLEIFFKDAGFDIITLINDVNESLLRYLVGISRNVKTFSKFRSMANKFTIIISRERIKELI